MNMFGSNQQLLGSLKENLILQTAGKIKIRYGNKFIDLLDNDGNINIKLPKTLNKIDSQSELKSNGFYILDGILYAYYDKNLIQISGIEGQFLSYLIQQELNQDQIDTVQKNIGLKFTNINDAIKNISEGIVFVNDEIYYINNGSYKNIVEKLNTPLQEINKLPQEVPYAVTSIVNKDGEWQYEELVTKKFFNDYINEQNTESNNKQKNNLTYNLIQYSKYYDLNSIKFIIYQDDKSSPKYIKNVEFKTELPHNLQNGDVCIISFVTYIGEIINGKPQIKNSENKKIITFQFEYENDNGTDKLYIINPTSGQRMNINVNNKDLDFQYVQYNGTMYCFVDSINNVLKNLELKLYIKAEKDNPNKFKVDYQNSEIAIEENYPKMEDQKFISIPHVVLGNLLDPKGYYNNPIIPFKTYEDNDNEIGLYSDQAVFTSTEFRQPLEYEEPEDDSSIKDVEIYNYPRYSKILNKVLCKMHSGKDLQEDDSYDEIVPTIGWIKEYINQQNEQLKEYIKQSIDQEEVKIKEYINNIITTQNNGVNN